MISFLRLAIKNYFIPIIVISLILYPSFSSATFLIELQNGTKFITHGFWQEKNLIKFYYYGGIVGFEKNRIIRLDESELQYPKEIKSSEKAEKILEPGNLRSQKEKKSTDAAIKDNNTDKKIDDQILNELDRLKEMEKRLDNKEDQGLYQYAKELTDLKKKIVNTGSGHIYDDQVIDLEDMLDKVEYTIKHREGRS